MKVVAVVKTHTGSLVTGRRKAEEVMSDLTKDVRALLPARKGPSK